MKDALADVGPPLTVFSLLLLSPLLAELFERKKEREEEEEEEGEFGSLIECFNEMCRLEMQESR